MGIRLKLTPAQIAAVFRSKDDARTTAERFGLKRIQVYQIRARITGRAATEGLTPVKTRGKRRLDYALISRLLDHGYTRRYNRGYSRKEIALLLGCTKSAISYAIRQHSEETRMKKDQLREGLSPLIDWNAVVEAYPVGSQRRPSGPKPVRTFRFLPGFVRKTAGSITARVYSVADQPKRAA